MWASASSSTPAASVDPLPWDDGPMLRAHSQPRMQIVCRRSRQKLAEVELLACEVLARAQAFPFAQGGRPGFSARRNLWMVALNEPPGDDHVGCSPGRLRSAADLGKRGYVATLECLLAGTVYHPLLALLTSGNANLALLRAWLARRNPTEGTAITS
jgi:hypothetical protein